MKNLIWLIILFAIAIGLALTANTYSGNVYLVIEETLLRINLHLFIISVILIVCVLYIVLRLIAGILGIKGAFGRLGSRRKARQAMQQLNQVGLAYFEGKYQQSIQLAEKVLKNKAAGDSRILALMFAAHAAAQSNNRTLYEQYVQELGKLPEKMQLSRYLLQAEDGLNRQDYAFAEQNLISASKEHARLIRVVALQLRLAMAQGNALMTLDKAEKLHQAGALNEQEMHKITEQAYRDLLQLAKDAKGMKAALKRIPESLKNNELCLAIAERYADLGLHPEVVKWVNQHYPHHQSAELLAIFVRSAQYLGKREQQKAIDTAESWLNEQPKNASLLQLLGELAYEQTLWGKARSYLEASLAIEKKVQTHLLLANVLDEMQDSEAAEMQRQQALALMAEGSDTH